MKKSNLAKLIITGAALLLIPRRSSTDADKTAKIAQKRVKHDKDEKGKVDDEKDRD